VGAYIGAAYFFTSSTRLANPAITVGRMFSVTFAGIAPSSAPWAFVLVCLSYPEPDRAEVSAASSNQRAGTGPLSEPWSPQPPGGLLGQFNPLTVDGSARLAVERTFAAGDQTEW